METSPNYIKVYDLPLGNQVCKELIEEFENNKDQQEEIKLDGHRSFNQILYTIMITGNDLKIG